MGVFHKLALKNASAKPVGVTVGVGVAVGSTWHLPLSDGTPFYRPGIFSYFYCKVLPDIVPY